MSLNFNLKSSSLEALWKRYPSLLSWTPRGPDSRRLEIMFEPKVSSERYIKRNDRVSSFGACILNIANEIFLIGGDKNPFQVAKLNGILFQFQYLRPPIPATKSLCTQPIYDSAIVCGTTSEDPAEDRKSCFTFDGFMFGPVSEESQASHPNAISTHFNNSIVLISVPSIETLRSDFKLLISQIIGVN